MPADKALFARVKQPAAESEAIRQVEFMFCRLPKNSWFREHGVLRAAMATSN
jgi:hypothetical protein